MRSGFRASPQTWFSPRAGAMSALALAALTACGGGGSDNPRITVPTGARVVAASAGADLTVDNYTVVSAELVRALVGSASNNLLDFSAGASREQAQAQRSAPPGAGLSPRLISALAFAAARQANPRERAAAVQTDTMACYGGTGWMSVTVNDADNNGRLSAGDSISLAVSDCVADAGLPAANGGFSMTINAVELDANQVPTALDVSASFNAFQVTGYGSMSGAFRLWSRIDSPTSGVARVSYRSTQVAEALQTVQYDFDVYTATSNGVASYEMSGGIVIGGQTFTIELGNAFADIPPAVGSLKLKDFGGDAVKLVATSVTTFDLDFYAASDAVTPAASQHGLLWSSYQQ